MSSFPFMALFLENLHLLFPFHGSFSKCNHHFWQLSHLLPIDLVTFAKFFINEVSTLGDETGVAVQLCKLADLQIVQLCQGFCQELFNHLLQIVHHEELSKVEQLTMLFEVFRDVDAVHEVHSNM